MNFPAVKYIYIYRENMHPCAFNRQFIHWIVNCRIHTKYTAFSSNKILKGCLLVDRLLNKSIACWLRLNMLKPNVVYTCKMYDKPPCSSIYTHHTNWSCTYCSLLRIENVKFIPFSCWVCFNVKYVRNALNIRFKITALRPLVHMLPNNPSNIYNNINNITIWNEGTGLTRWTK